MVESLSFYPWIPPGDDPRFRGIRLLIMGESHYDEGKPFKDEEKREHTRQVVRDWAAEATGYQKFFVNIYRTLNDDDADWSSPQFRQFWNSVHFCNYVQRFMRQPGDRPTKSDFAASADAFHDTLDELKPDAVLVVSKATWLAMGTRNAIKAFEDEQGLGDVWRYGFAGGSCLIAHTKHPSRNYDAAYWRPRVSRFLDRVLEAKQLADAKKDDGNH